VWDPDEVEWSVEVFDAVTDELVAQHALPALTEVEVRAHFNIDPAAEPIDGIKLAPSDVSWVSAHASEPLAFDAATQVAFVSVHARGDR